ncbi:hypothetical protein C922_00283 [Plasmodium inui San Antonio 1]|uniref:Uncharacterized protein n=1 Tax=Plasmodium inui San Antonio 1 TaxID=1237626 RepID=W7ACI0_9APIC|nr:hypothetical protein C922_00283 [Plasmodium inui San Antonio 1]EUD69420.1 hypothetical protein C922_00283 [Plasmodium inui San Antonio 1]
MDDLDGIKEEKNGPRNKILNPKEEAAPKDQNERTSVYEVEIMIIRLIGRKCHSDPRDNGQTTPEGGTPEHRPRTSWPSKKDFVSKKIEDKILDEKVPNRGEPPAFRYEDKKYGPNADLKENPPPQEDKDWVKETQEASTQTNNRADPVTANEGKKSPEEPAASKKHGGLTDLTRTRVIREGRRISQAAGGDEPTKQKGGLKNP